MRARLQPLIESDSRVSFLAKELLAIEAWEAGDLDLARTTIENLSLALNAPEAVRQRAQDRARRHRPSADRQSRRSGDAGAA